MRASELASARVTCVLILGLAVLPAGVAGQAVPDSTWLGSKGFFRRTDDALLHGDRAALRDWEGRTVSRLAQRSPRIELRGGGEGFFVLHETEDWRGDDSDAGCILPIYLNGGRIHPAGGGHATVRAVDRAISPRNLDGLELHGIDTSPVGEGIPCGALLLWSRQIRAHVDEEFAGRLRGRATWSPEGVPAGGIAVALEPGGELQTTDSGGWFDFGALPPGRYRITATAPDGASWTSEMILKAFAIAQIAIEVSREEGGAW